MEFLIKSVGYTLYILGRKCRRFMGNVLGFIWFDILRFRRTIILENLQRAFPEKNFSERILIGRKSVQWMGFHFLDLLSLPFWQDHDYQAYIVIEGEDFLKESLKQQQGRGVYFLSLHLGNGDLGANALQRLGYSIHIITKRFKNKNFDQAWFRVRGPQGVSYIEAHGQKTAFDIFKVLKKNGIVVFVLDQFMGRPYGVPTHFFGHATGTAYGLALFYQKNKDPILPVYTYEGSDQRFHVVIKKPLDLLNGVGDDLNQEYTQKFNNELETIVRQYPEQWMWVHRRWKSFE